MKKLEKFDLFVNERSSVCGAVLDKRFGRQFEYVLDCIKYSSAAADEGLQFNSDKEAVSFLVAKFNEQYNSPYEKRIYPNIQDRIENWFRGLPSSCSMAWNYTDIVEVGKSWGFCKTQRSADKFVENWFRVLAFRVVQMAHKLGIKIG